MAARGKTIRGRKAREIPWKIVGAVAVVVLIAVAGSVLMRGYGKRKADPFAAWGGMSKEEWLKQHKDRRESEAKKEEERRRDAEAEKRKNDEAKRAAEEAKKAQNAAEPPKVAASPGNPTPGPTATTPPSVAEAKMPQTAPLPKDLAAWKDADFFAARSGNDPRLLAALEYRAERFPNEEPQAVFLRNLLAPKPSTDAKDSAAATKPPLATPPLPPQALALIAKTLAANRTSAGRQLIADILAGTLRLEDDEALLQATLKAMAETPSDENNSVLLAALTQPGVVRAFGQGRITPADLQRLALGVIDQSGGSGIRQRLAKEIAEPACAADLRNLAIPLLERNRPENLEAQSLLFRSARMAPEVETRIERQLLECSHKAVIQVFGLGDDRMRTAALGAETNGEWVARAVRVLWDRGVAALLNERQVAMDTLGQSPTTVLLAATIPRTEARLRLARTFARHWEESPDALVSAGWTKSFFGEPGILPVLKSVRDTRPNADSEEAKRAAASVRSSAKRGDPSKSEAEARKTEKGKSEKARKAWLAAEEAVVREYCRRLLIAGLEKARDRRASDRAKDAENAVPLAGITLHPEASVVASHRVRWPGVQAAKDGGAGCEPVDVSYVRIEEMGFPRAVLGHYLRVFKQRMDKPAQTHSISDGVWLEGLVSNDEDGQCRSVDVLLTRANAKSETPPDKRQEITVEVLVVTVPSLQAGPRMKAQARAEPVADGLP